MGRIVLGSADYEHTDPPRGLRHAGPGEVDRIHARATKACPLRGGKTAAREQRFRKTFLRMLLKAGIFVDGA